MADDDRLLGGVGIDPGQFSAIMSVNKELREKNERLVEYVSGMVEEVKGLRERVEKLEKKEKARKSDGR